MLPTAAMKYLIGFMKQFQQIKQTNIMSQILSQNFKDKQKLNRQYFRRIS